MPLTVELYRKRYKPLKAFLTMLFTYCFQIEYIKCYTCRVVYTFRFDYDNLWEWIDG